MANVFFNRDTRVFLVQGTTVWEIPVLAGHAFAQPTNTSEVTLAEMTDAAGNSRRGRTMFTDSQAPADWSFDTYVRPSLNGTAHVAVEEALWANFVARPTFTPGAAGAAGAWSAGITRAAGYMDVDFAASNKTQLGEFDLYFVLGAPRDVAPASFTTGANTFVYRVENASINEVSITFDIDGIATLGWSGNGRTVREVATWTLPSAPIRSGIETTSNFIRNRLTQLSIVQRNAAGTADVGSPYDITLTGGTITLTNNLSYLTPEVIGVVNAPLGHVTGTRAIGGSFTCYLDSRTNGSGDLFDTLSRDAVNVRNVFALTFAVGGTTGTPRVEFVIPRAHITVPTHDIGDVISVGVDFTALPSDFDTPNEVTRIRYVGVAS